MIVYLLIDGRKFIPHKEKFRVFTDKNRCLAEARKLGYGQSIFGEMATLGDKPGVVIMEQGGDMDVTMIPIEIEGEARTFQGAINADGSAEGPCQSCGSSMEDHYGGICAQKPKP